MAFARNLLSDLMREGDFAYLLSVDGDIMLHPATLGVLLGLGRDQASVLVGNTAPPDEPWAWNVLDWTVDGQRITHIEPYQTGGTCGATGAACLYSRSILENCRFHADPQGEDIGFARHVRQVDPKFRAAYVPCGAHHCMVPPVLAKHVSTCTICKPMIVQTKEMPAEAISLEEYRTRKADQDLPEGTPNFDQPEPS
jgi:hypothetical protein